MQSIRDDHESPFLFLEGPRLVKELLNADQPIEILVWTPAAEVDPVIRSIQGKASRLCQVSASVFSAISDVRSPQGILAIARRPLWDWKNLFGRAPAPIVILDGIQDPGNVATIVRTAEAAGAAGIVTTPETASLFSPKALRGSAGSSLRLPILEHRDAEEIICALRVAGCGILAADAQNGPEGAVSYSHVDWTKPWAIVLGQEGSGLSAGWQAARRVFIPMKPVVESLNVAAAAAILLFEFHRQREQA